jgi:hypothetical protein
MNAIPRDIANDLKLLIPVMQVQARDTMLLLEAPTLKQGRPAV